MILVAGFLIAFGVLLFLSGIGASLHVAAIVGAVTGGLYVLLAHKNREKR